MKLHLVRHMWGVNLPVDIAFAKFAARGYTAIEMPLPGEPAPLKAALEANNLAFFPMIFTTGGSVAEHVDSFRWQVRRAISVGGRQVTVQSGQDAFTLSESLDFYRQISSIEADLPIVVAHETHRGRVFYNPWNTRDVLLECPAIRIVADFSHWVCVAERLEWDDSAGSILRLIAPRVMHVHARVGLRAGPTGARSFGPRIHAGRCGALLSGGKAIWQVQRLRGDAVSTVTPEFGPPRYLHTLPHTNTAVANLEEVCEWMANRVNAEFKTHVV